MSVETRIGWESAQAVPEMHAHGLNSAHNIFNATLDVGVGEQSLFEFHVFQEVEGDNIGQIGGRGGTLKQLSDRSGGGERADAAGAEEIEQLAAMILQVDLQDIRFLQRLDLGHAIGFAFVFTKDSGA